MSEHDVRVELSPKRVRAFLGGLSVFDTTEPRLVWEVPYYPQYYVPSADVQADLVRTGRTKTSRSRGVGYLHTVRIGGAEAVEAATTYDESPVEALRGLVRFKFGELDAWFEEDEQVYTHPRSPYTRVDILPTSREVVVTLGDVELARTTRAHALFETGLPTRWYVPRVDVRMALLARSGTVTHCPYKGETVHFSARAGGDEVADVAWSYPTPLPESERIAGLVAF